MGQIRCAILAIVAVASAAGCGRDLRDSIADHRASVERKLEGAREARDAVRAAPAFAGGSISLGGPAPHLARPAPHGPANTAVAYLEDLADPKELGNVPHRLAQSGLLNRCASALVTHRAPFDPRASTTTPAVVTGLAGDDLFDQCEALRYVVVIRTVAYAAPTSAETTSSCGAATEGAAVVGGADAGPRDAGAGARDAGAGSRDAGAVDASAAAWPASPATCLRFDGGFLRAEAFVFDLETRALLGGFAFEAASSARLDVAADRGGPKGAVEADLVGEIANELRKAAIEAMPSCTVEDAP